MANIMLSLSILFVVIVSNHCYGSQDFLSFAKLLREKPVKSDALSLGSESETSGKALPVFVSPQDGLKENDKIERLPGQPDGVNFNQYSGYVNVESERAFFYYFAESPPQDSPSKPLLLWFSGVPGCSSIGVGAWTEIGPFRVNKDGKTLYCNDYAWNSEANLLFVDAPAGVGFSYSKNSATVHSGDMMTAYDTYTFLVNWLERFPEYKNRDLFLAGEAYGGHYATQLAQLILHQNKHSNQTTAINLKGIALGNAYIDYESSFYGSFDYLWTHAFISDEIYAGVYSNCNISSDIISDKCKEYLELSENVTARINPYDIYASLCNSTPGANPYSYVGPCSTDYVADYIANPEVQLALHANTVTVPYPWKICSFPVNWTDAPTTMLPIITELMESGIPVWIYSGDTDSSIPVTSAKYAVNKLKLSVKTAWYPWYFQNEVGGYVVEYRNLVFVTVRGAGAYVPDSQPARALALFSSFVNGTLPPST